MRPRNVAALLPLALLACEQDVWLGAPVDARATADVVASEPTGCLRAEPARLVLGTVAEGVMRSLALRVQNACDEPVEIAGFVFGGDPGFSVAFGGRVWVASTATAQEGVRVDPPVIVPPGGAVDLEVRYEPTSSQAAYASLVLRPGADDPGPVATAEANTASPCVATAPKALDFGGWPPGDEAAGTVTVASCGKGVLEVNAIRLAPGSASAFAVTEPPGGPPWVVPPGESLALDLTYAPDAAAPKRDDGHPEAESGALVLHTNAFRPEHRVELSGFGVDEPCPRAIASADLGPTVPPGTTVTLDGRASYGAHGPLSAWSWTAEGPGGAPVRLDPSPGSPRVQARLGLVGRYTFTLDVRDAEDSACAPAEVTIDVLPPDEGLLIELSWRTPGDPDPTDAGPGAGADLDLHVAHPLAVGRDLDGDGAADRWFDLPFDVHWANPTPDWAVMGDTGDDPRLDRDDVDGGGPEVVVLRAPEAGVRYRVGVHAWDDHGYGPSTARLRVWADGEAAGAPLERELLPHQLWEAATVDWPSAGVTPCAEGCVGAVSDVLPGK